MTRTVDSHNSTTRKIPFKILIAYENVIAGIRAHQMSDRLAAQLDPDFEVSSDMWKFDLLDHPQLRDQAALEASEADMIIISSHEKELPDEVKHWIESWLPRKKEGEAALVAMLGEEKGASWESQVLRDFLQRMAERGRMDFFCTTDQRASEEEYVPQPDAPCYEEDVVPVLNDKSRPSWQKWGTND